MEPHELLHQLPPPDPAAPERVWRRFEASRRAPRASWTPRLVVGGGVLAAAAAALLWLRPEAPREEVLSAEGRLAHAWSDQVSFDVDGGRGVVAGTDRDVVVRWETGDLHVEVAPGTGTSLRVESEEATVRVIGTGFTVRRDALGVTTTVQHGKVAVRCADGSWEGTLVADDAPRTCLPLRPGALLGRADALLAAHDDADGALVLETLDRGLASAEPGSDVEGELLARRVQALARAGDLSGAARDAERYVAGHQARTREVLASTARLALSRGCAAALPWLERLEPTGTAEDRVLLASCVAAADPARAALLVDGALASGEPIDPAWRAWAETYRGAR